VPDEYLAADDARLAPSRDPRAARRAVTEALVDAGAEKHRVTILQFLDAHPDALHRSCAAGHLTGSALVVSAEGDRVAMLRHRKLGLWLQPGGHCDGDGNLASVALREATEETGVEGLRVDPVAVDLDVHEVDPPSEPRHLHLDSRFLVVAPPGAALAGNPESTAIRWCRPDEVAALGVDSGTLRMVRHGLARRFRVRDCRAGE
jgi:8-oxo-dGTP pyrophosphatase MutT (NUDIX family)